MVTSLYTALRAVPAFAAAIFIASGALAFDPLSPAPLNLDEGIALKGHDPVASFTTGAPTMGSEAFIASEGGSTYLFATAENRDTFIADPERYLPAYGGFCAMAMSFGKKVDIDPNAWAIVDDQLYVQANPQAATVWQRDIPGNIVKADGHWPNVKDTAPANL
jgi:YHS domain-containing protein